MAGKVDQDIDPSGADLRVELVVGELRNAAPMIGGAPEAFGDIVFEVRAGIAGDLETPLVVMKEDRLEEQRR
jgi:hypothetical protein